MLAGLMLQGATPVHKGLARSGKIHTCCLHYGNKFAYLNFFQSLQQVCALLMQGAHTQYSQKGHYRYAKFNTRINFIVS